MIRNTKLNKIFKSKKIRDNKALKEKALEYNKTLKALSVEINTTPLSLGALLETHKRLWASGIKLPEVSYYPYGMFRKPDIEALDLEDVYLGGIYGLCTFKGSYLEGNKNAKYGVSGYNINPDTTIYTLCANQYWKVLKKAIEKAIKQNNDKITQFIAAGY